MKNLKRIAVAVTVTAVLATAGAAFAAELKRPVEIVSGLTGQSIENLRSKKLEEQTTYGSIARSLGVSDEFKAQMMDQKASLLSERVQNGILTQEEADDILASICTEDKQILLGKDFSASFGKGLHMNEDGQGKMENRSMGLDGQGRGPGRGKNR